MPDFSALTNDRLIAAEEGLHTMFEKAAAKGVDTENIVLTHEDLGRELRDRRLLYEPLAKADGHSFIPVRNVCRNCRRHGSEHGDADHDFVPVRNICRNCGQGIAVHVQKAVGDLGVEDRQAMAQTGIAMPDGSFPIPDEAHLHAAVRLVAQANDPQAAMNHIIERAKAMGMVHVLPPAWQFDPNADPGNAVGEGAHTLQPGGKPQPNRAPGASPAGGNASGPPKQQSTMPPGNGQASPGKPPKPQGVMKRLAKAVASAMGADFDEESFLKELEINLDPEFEYAIVKASGEKRYTLGPVYMPDTLDAHDEWATAEDLEKAAWDYFKSDDHNVYLQHSDQKAGELVALMPWPNEVQATMVKSINGVQKSVTTTFPAGTVYAGVLWEPWAWAEIKKQNITGFSMGGFARRLEGAPA